MDIKIALMLMMALKEQSILIIIDAKLMAGNTTIYHGDKNDFNQIKRNNSKR